MKKLTAHESYLDDDEILRSREIDLTEARASVPTRIGLLFYYDSIGDRDTVNFITQNLGNDDLFELVEKRIKERDE